MAKSRSGVAESWGGIAAALIVITVLAVTNTTAVHRPVLRAKRSSITTSVPPSQPSAVDPAVFSPGACIAFPPTAVDRHQTVFLDAGHGGIDPGATGKTQTGQTIYEANETLPVELDAMAILRANGFRVVVSRTGATAVTRISPNEISSGGFTTQGAREEGAARDVCANEAGATALVGIYFDASESSESAGSITAFDPDRPFASQNILLANLVQHDVLTTMNAQGWGIPDAGVKADVKLGSATSSQAVAYGHLLLIGPAKAGYFSTPSQMPGALIEPLFITDPVEGSIAASSEGQQVIASGLAQAIEQYFATPGAPPTPSTTASPKAHLSDR